VKGLPHHRLAVWEKEERKEKRSSNVCPQIHHLAESRGLKSSSPDFA
jgi:hypothetical protein